MASSNDEFERLPTSDKKNEILNGISWTNIRKFQHRYLFDNPHKVDQHMQVNIGLPTPILPPIKIKHDNKYREILRSQQKLDTRLAYCRKLYSKHNKLRYKKLINERKFVVLPQYIVDVSQGVFSGYEDLTWHYTGGTLDVLSFGNEDILLWTGFQQPLKVINLNVPSSYIEIDLNEESPIYNFKCVVDGENFVTIVRQKSRVSFFNLCNNSNKLQSNKIWEFKIEGRSFADVAFNEFKNSEFAVIDSQHKIKMKNYIMKKDVAQYTFEDDILNDNYFAQIRYIDGNTIAFINRCCLHLLDLRCLTVRKVCLKTTWLKCDDLCTISNHSNSLLISSMHNIINFDIRSLDMVSRTFHMLSSPPFISSYINVAEKGFICLSGDQYDDKVLAYCSDATLHNPQYVPSTRDAFIKTSLTEKIDIGKNLEERLTLPTMGIKLYNNNSGDGINLYTTNSVGDVFKQKITQNQPCNEEAITNLAEWTAKIPYTPKILEATSICNLSNIMHSISHNLPKEENLKAFMSENSKQQLFEKEYSKLTEFVEGSVGESMNVIWEDDKLPVDADEDPELSSQNKVSKWLDSVL